MTGMQLEPIPSAAWAGLQRAVMLHLFDPNVSLVDLGWRIRDQRNQRLEPELCVRVHVETKLYNAAFEAFAEAQPERVIDARRIGFPVDVPVGDYRPQLLYGVGATHALPRNYAFDPLRGGISISNATTDAYGTLGGFVVDRRTKKLMLLSNWHVLFGGAFAYPGMDVYQPGCGDGGHRAYTIAHVTRHAMDQLIDAAVAELTGTRQQINDQLDIGPVTGVETPQLGMRLVKSGRRTGVTTGIVSGIGGRMTLSYRGVQRVVRDVVHIAPVPAGGEVSAGGDSGSWWLNTANNAAVGLHFAGSNAPEYALAIAMPQVLDALNVDIIANVRRAQATIIREMEVIGGPTHVI